LLEDKIITQPKEINNENNQLEENEVQGQNHEEQSKEIIEDPELINIENLDLEINEGSPNGVLTIKENLEPIPKDQT